jgi:hypothetical protein
MKTVAFKTPAKPAPVAADDWVRSRGATTDQEVEPPAPAETIVPAEPMKRLTIDVSESLHKRMKAQCALRGSKMADVVRDLLEREFPAS